MPKQKSSHNSIEPKTPETKEKSRPRNSISMHRCEQLILNEKRALLPDKQFTKDLTKKLVTKAHETSRKMIGGSYGKDQIPSHLKEEGLKYAMRVLFQQLASCESKRLTIQDLVDVPGCYWMDDELTFKNVYKMPQKQKPSNLIPQTP